jgi:pimeloyl-ACP methyl ester carboxylesterase
MSALFAATYPRRVSALVLYGSWARTFQAPDYPIGPPQEMFQSIVDLGRDGWVRRGCFRCWRRAWPTMPQSLSVTDGPEPPWNGSWTVCL